ncbi:phage tail protein [Morganella morganii]|uniref:phage tail protein n=1 Tax=Morganella morganii TaxID=582 RepID=UPI0032DB3A4F
MTAKYFAILTNYGAAQLANAVALGTKLSISTMAVGDGGGVLPVPDPAQTKLIRETRRAAINQLSVDEKNANYIVAEQVIPENEGGWFIREIGLFDDKGGLIAVGNAPETYKPNLQEGSGRTQVIQMVLMVSSTDAITLKVDPTVVLATRDFVTKSVTAAIQESEAKTAKTYATKTELSSGLSGKQPTGDYATRTELSNGLSGKQPTGDYALRTEMSAALKSIETPVSVFEHFPHRAAQLPPKWYSVNGDRFSVTSPQGKALKALTPEFKSDWGIVESGGMINVPNIKQSDGRTAILKPVNGTSRQVGSLEQDMQRAIKGEFAARILTNGRIIYEGYNLAEYTPAHGAFDIGARHYKSDGNDYGAGATDGIAKNSTSTVTKFDSGRVVPTGIENTVLNVGVTLAIYLGV